MRRIFIQIHTKNTRGLKGGSGQKSDRGEYQCGKTIFQPRDCIFEMRRAISLTGLSTTKDFESTCSKTSASLGPCSGRFRAILPFCAFRLFTSKSSFTPAVFAQPSLSTTWKLNQQPELIISRRAARARAPQRETCGRQEC